MYKVGIAELELESSFSQGVKDMRLMAQGAPSADRIVRALGLQAYYDFFRAKCSSNHLPYHNEYHTTCMLLNCYEGYLLSVEKLTTEERQAIVLGALYHDADHTGGVSQDTVNIERAVDLLWQAHSYCMARGASVDASVLIRAVSCVRTTQYPHVGEPKNMLEAIMRDADLMQVYEDDTAAMVAQYLGLRDELGVRLGTSISKGDFAAQCKTFVDGAVWHTAWAKEKAARLNLAQRSERLYTEILDEPGAE